MTKTILQLNEETIGKLEGMPETGMGYYFVQARFVYDSEKDHIIFGNYFLIPLYPSNYFSISDFAQEPFPFKGEFTLERTNIKISKVYSREEIIAKVYSRNEVTIPDDYAPIAGAVRLLGTATLKNPTWFYRYIGSPTDPRLSTVSGADTLAADTYLTSKRDRRYANTGFGAVGRYALPLPIPASWVFKYQFPAGTPIRVGTTVPMFGQSGGGVEIQTVGPVTLTGMIPAKAINDY